MMVMKATQHSPYSSRSKYHTHFLHSFCFPCYFASLILKLVSRRMNATLAAQQQFIKTRKKRIVGALPFIFAELIFTFVYYVFVVRWIPTLFALQVESAVAQVLLFHVLFVLCQASFFKTTLTDPGSIPDGYLEHVRPFFSIFSPSLSSSPTSFFFTPLNPFSFHPSLIPINTEEN